MGFKLRPGTSVFGNVTFTPGTNENYVAPAPATTTSPEPAPAPSAKWVVVGVPYDNGEMGSVYVYDATDLSAQPTKLTAFDAAGGDKFGWSVASTNDKIIVGAYNDDDGPTGPSSYLSNSGSVYVFDANDLSAQPTKLTAFDVAMHSWFGWSVSAFDDKIVTGARNDGVAAEGAVYVYDANDLSAQPTKLTAFDGAGGDTFGYSVASTNDKIVVGTYGDDDGGANSGSVYVYDATDLTSQPTKLLPTDIAANDFFGLSVASFGDMIVVGSPNDDDDVTNSGSVYVYDATDLTSQPTKLTAFDAAVGDKFGWSVASINDKIVVGARDDQDNGTQSGSVYVYDANDLSAQPTKLTAFDGAADDFFGKSVAAFDDKIIVGSYKDDDNGDRSGSVYVYDANDLSAQPTKLTAFDGGEYDQYGKSVAIG